MCSTSLSLLLVVLRCRWGRTGGVPSWVETTETGRVAGARDQQRGAADGAWAREGSVYTQWRWKDGMKKRVTVATTGKYKTIANPKLESAGGS